MNSVEDFFLKPIHATQKKYEVLRALYVEHLKAKEAAKKFGYAVHTVNAMKRDFIKAMKENKIASSDYFVTYSAGRRKDQNKSEVKEKIIQLRKQNYSVLDIKSVLHADGNKVSHDYIHRVLLNEGFARLLRRTQVERKRAGSKIIKAPQSRQIDWDEDNGKVFYSERGIGVLSFLPILSWLGIHKWIEHAGYPETRELSCVQSVLSFIALKLAGANRYSQDDLWAMDRGLGLFSGLNVLPKDSTLSSYSYRTDRTMNKKFLTIMFEKLRELNLLDGSVNMDFTTIPHWGDASVLENNWSGKRNKALKSVLAALCQDPDTGVLCYGNAELKHSNQADFAIEFVDFWKQSGQSPNCLIFDSKFTTYQNLEKLDKDHIKFITIRRRSKKLLSGLGELPAESWKEIKVEGTGRKHEKVKINESHITLPGTSCQLRQIIISGNGHEKETFIITNDEDRHAAKIIRQYGKRWNVEKGISEQIEFFHLNSLSSSIVVKVDFDLTMTITAHNLYRIIAQKLIGFEKELSYSLNNKFFTNGGQFKIENNKIIVEMKKKRHLPILIDALKLYKDTPIPWLNQRNIVFTLWATS